MRKQFAITLSSALIISLLTACGNQSNISPIQLSQSPILSQAAKTNEYLSFAKKDDGTEKKSDLEIKEKTEKASVKKPEELKIKLPAVKNYPMDERDVASIARYALREMHAAVTYSEGYRAGLKAIKKMARDGVYVARVSLASAESTIDWQNGYKVVAAALNHMAEGNPNTPYEACNLVLSMMKSTNSYSDGYRAGLGAMNVIGQTDNHRVRYIVESAIRAAESTYSSERSYNIIRDALLELRRSF